MCVQRGRSQKPKTGSLTPVVCGSLSSDRMKEQQCKRKTHKKACRYVV